MSQKVRIPAPLRKLTNNEEIVVVNTATLGVRCLAGRTRKC
jgi:hypothetical protein